MSRIHAFEFEDLSWFPSTIRNYGTDFLQFVTNIFDFYKGVAPKIAAAMNQSSNHRVIDLASGGGGGWMKLSDHLIKEIPTLQVVLTDYYPNKKALQRITNKKPDIFSFKTAAVDATDVPENLKGFRTQFLSFHHFKPEEARKILQNAVNSHQPIGIFEGQQRDIPHFIKNFFSPISVLLATPFIKPFSIGRLFFTYILPIVPLFVWWDGIISVLRTYSVKEMQELVNQLNHKDQFNWEIGVSKHKGVSVPYLIGIPK